MARLIYSWNLRISPVTLSARDYVDVQPIRGTKRVTQAAWHSSERKAFTAVCYSSFKSCMFLQKRRTNSSHFVVWNSGSLALLSELLAACTSRCHCQNKDFPMSHLCATQCGYTQQAGIPNSDLRLRHDDSVNICVPTVHCSENMPVDLVFSLQEELFDIAVPPIRHNYCL